MIYPAAADGAILTNPATQLPGWSNLDPANPSGSNSSTEYQPQYTGEGSLVCTGSTKARRLRATSAHIFKIVGLVEC